MRVKTWLSATLLATVAGCGKEAPPEAEPLPVTVAEVGERPAGLDETRYGGAIEADASVDLAFKVNGVVDVVTMVRGADGRLRTLQDGDVVRRGMVLARLRQSEFQDQVTDAEAAFRQAEADYERAAQLYENRAVSKAEYDAAYARYTAGQAKRSQAGISLGDATLRSPIDGVILRKVVEPGSLAGPATPAFTIADTRVVKVVFGVPDLVVARLTAGAKVPIHAEALPAVALEGRITRIAPSADPASRVFEVEAALPNPDRRLKVGMLATLLLEREAPSAQLFVPLAAVIRPAGDPTGYAVYVICDSSEANWTATQKRIELGEVRGNLVGIRSGLVSGERVIVRGATIVAEGQTVRAIR